MTTRRESRLRRVVIERAGWRCEYCRAPQGPTGQTFHLDHIVPEVRGGEWTEENLALACPHCNLARGGQESARDPRTGQIVRLFDPRRDVWERHFSWSPNRSRLMGRTANGRATIQALKMNAAGQLEARMWWYLMGLIP
ncbi:MAG: HNH endonuclease [Acidobacteria bacterium]|nr:MAG: HNH endonuclease [Acidobacteriota bacterium]